MITTDLPSPTLQRLEELRPLCPDMRLGQVLATIAMLPVLDVTLVVGRRGQGASRGG